MIVVGVKADKAVFDKLVVIGQKLNLQLTWQQLDKMNQKSLMSIACNGVLLAIIKHVPMMVYADDELIKLTPNWQSLTNRIVTAGRKSELILQACKLTKEMTVIDATAGFGHDGLLLASTGASVTMIENHPLMALILLYEYQCMLTHPNWQKLLERICIVHQDATKYLDVHRSDVVYLDPMFPADSYQAKVSKYMQVLHYMTKPPTVEQEHKLLACAKMAVNSLGRVVVKRPKSAPNLAGQLPTKAYANESIRFDVYDVW